MPEAADGTIKNVHKVIKLSSKHGKTEFIM
jgi:hypothetical protein